MKTKQTFKNIKKPADINQEVLKAYLVELYKGNEDLVKQGNILIDKLIEVTRNNKFESLRNTLIKSTWPGETQNIIKEIKKTAEVILYKSISRLIATPERFKSEVKSATIDACDAGALTNMQKILFAMDDSLYAQKFDFIQNLATAYVREHNLTDYRIGYEVHVANELIHEVSQDYNVTPSLDVYAKYRDLTQSPKGRFIKNAKFKEYLEQHLASREGIYSFVEVVSDSYLSKLPDAPSQGEKLPAKVKIRDGKFIDSEQIEQLSSVADSLNITLTSIIEYSEDGAEFRYKPNYIAVIKAATTQKLINEDIIEQQSLAIESSHVMEIPARDAHQRDVDGKLQKIHIPASARIIKARQEIIESPDGWYLSEVVSDRIEITRKLFDTKECGGLTISGKNVEDYIHDNLKELLEDGMNFDDSLRVIIESNENKVALPESNPAKELILLSDQSQILKLFLTAEEILSLAATNNLLEFADLVREDSSEALPFIARYGDKQLLTKYMEYTGATNQDLMKWRYKDGSTLLNFAAQAGNLSMIDELINFGININIRNAEGKTALHYAASNGCVEVIDRLIDKGANKNARDIEGETALHYAVQYNHIEAISKLVEKGAAIDVKNLIGSTALHKAAIKGKVEAIDKLIEMGANKEIKNNYGNTALHCAAACNHVEAIDKLIEMGAKKDTQNRSGHTPLYWAALLGHVEAITKLIEKGAAIETYLLRFRPMHNSIAQGVVNRKKDMSSEILSLINKSAGWFYDNKDGWELIDKIIKHEDLKESRVEIVKQVLSSINSQSRRNKLLSFLDEDERRGIKPMESLWQRALKFMKFFSIKVDQEASLEPSKLDGSRHSDEQKEIPEKVKRQSQEVVFFEKKRVRSVVRNSSSRIPVQQRSKSI